jgi:hypothetical protein
MSETKLSFVKLNHDLQKIILTNNNNIFVKTHSIHEFDLEKDKFLFLKFPCKGQESPCKIYLKRFQSFINSS